MAEDPRKGRSMIDFVRAHDQLLRVGSVSEQVLLRGLDRCISPPPVGESRRRSSSVPPPPSPDRRSSVCGSVSVHVYENGEKLCLSGVVNCEEVGD
jgi:hypothetical protein